MAVTVKLPTQLRDAAGDGLKTLGAVEGTFDVTEIAPSIDEFDAAFAPTAAAA